VGGTTLNLAVVASVLDPRLAKRKLDPVVLARRGVSANHSPHGSTILLVVMGPSLLDEAFAHHVWATLRLIDTCLSLTPEQLMAAVPGTYGSILETTRHLVEADTYYLAHLTSDPAREIDSGAMGLRELRAEIGADERTWTELLATDLDPDVVVTDVDEEGYRRDAPMGVRLAQAIHHGTDHRSQICTVLTTLGLEPPLIDVWAFGVQTGRIVEVPPASSR
jgi:uncharacterized damage-inducible protein DinB